MFEDLQNLFLKGLLVLLTSPLWYPLLRAVWEEFNEAMAEEGGVFGRTPTARELEDIRRSRASRPDPLVHEPWSERERARDEARREQARQRRR
jgi:hypothetical protein